MSAPAMVHLGFDASTTGAGAVLLGHDDRIIRAWCWQATKDIEGAEHVDRRVALLGDWASEIYDHVFDRDLDDLWDSGCRISCAIEAPFFRGASSAALAEAQGAIKSRIGQPFGRYTAAEVKATAHRLTGVKTSGNGAGKAPMQTAAERYWHGGDGRTGAMWVINASSQHADHPKALGDLVDALWVAKTDQLACAATVPAVLDGAR